MSNTSPKLCSKHESANKEPTMTRAEFNRLAWHATSWDWCLALPHLNPLELWQQCPRSDWMLIVMIWLKIPKPSGFLYDCTNRAIMHANAALDIVGVEHGLRWVIVTDPATAAAACAAANTAYAAACDMYADRRRRMVSCPQNRQPAELAVLAVLRALKFLNSSPAAAIDAAGYCAETGGPLRSDAKRAAAVRPELSWQADRLRHYIPDPFTKGTDNAQQ